MSLLNPLSQLSLSLDLATCLGALTDLIPGFMGDMKPRQRVTLLLPIAYMLGSVPFGLVVGRLKGIDVTRHGSGNIGATNVGRLLGRKYFFIVFLLDMLKGLLPMLAAMVLLSDAKAHQSGQLSTNQNIMWLAVGFTAIIGHMFSAFLRFRGGKGIATSSGVILGLFPYFTLPGIGVFLVWFITFKLTRYVSVASILAAISFPLIYIGVGIWQGWPLTGGQLPLGIFAVIVAILLVVKHRSNIRRLMQGKEPHYHPRSHRHDHHSEAEASA
jgi:glycerol-3-phosphate acyltransferase PlsY